jgi:hypothetical protein
MAREKELWASAGLSQCGGLRAKGRVYWGFLWSRKSAENVERGRAGGGERRIERSVKMNPGPHTETSSYLKLAVRDQAAPGCSRERGQAGFDVRNFAPTLR